MASRADRSWEKTWYRDTGAALQSGMWFGWDKSTCSGSTMEAAQTSDGRAATGAPATGSQPKECCSPAHSTPQIGARSPADRSWGKTRSRDKEKAWGSGVWSSWGGSSHCWHLNSTPEAAQTSDGSSTTSISETTSSDPLSQLSKCSGSANSMPQPCTRSRKWKQRKGCKLGLCLSRVADTNTGSTSDFCKHKSLTYFSTLLWAKGLSVRRKNNTYLKGTQGCILSPCLFNL